MKIAIAGTGYVGLSNAILLSQKNEVIALDIIQEKVDMINDKKSPIIDKEIDKPRQHDQIYRNESSDPLTIYFVSRCCYSTCLFHHSIHPHSPVFC